MKGILDIFLERTAEPMIERILRGLDRIGESKTKAEVIDLKNYRNGRALRMMKRKDGSDLA